MLTCFPLVYSLPKLVTLPLYFPFSNSPERLVLLSPILAPNMGVKIAISMDTCAMADMGQPLGRWSQLPKMMFIVDLVHLVQY